MLDQILVRSLVVMRVLMDVDDGFGGRGISIGCVQAWRQEQRR